MKNYCNLNNQQSRHIDLYISGLFLPFLVLLYFCKSRQINLNCSSISARDCKQSGINYFDCVMQKIYDAGFYVSYANRELIRNISKEYNEIKQDISFYDYGFQGNDYILDIADNVDIIMQRLRALQKNGYRIIEWWSINARQNYAYHFKNYVRFAIIVCYINNVAFESKKRIKPVLYGDVKGLLNQNSGSSNQYFISKTSNSIVLAFLDKYDNQYENSCASKIRHSFNQEDSQQLRQICNQVEIQEQNNDEFKSLVNDICQQSLLDIIQSSKDFIQQYRGIRKSQNLPQYPEI